jgi:hypothetical protein
MVNFRLVCPTTPLVTRPVWTPTRTRTGAPVWGSVNRCASERIASANSSISAAESAAASDWDMGSLEVVAADEDLEDRVEVTAGDLSSLEE